MPLFALGSLCEVSVSSVNERVKCFLCGEKSATKRIETRLCGLLVDSYLACEECGRNAIVPAFEIQGAEVSWEQSPKTGGKP